MNGSFGVSSSPATYTTNVGDSFEFEFTGKTLYFDRRMENRGGMWEFELSNGLKKIMNCFRDSSSHIYRSDIVFDGLSHEKHYGKATFIGGDPNNPANDGTPRGYLTYSEDETVRPLTTGKVKPINDSTVQYITPTNSILDFAVSARPEGADYGTEWVPQHSSVSGVSSNVFYKIFVDGTDLFKDDVLAINYQEINDFEISQKFSATNPNGSDGTMWTHYVNHSIRKNKPYLSIQNKMKINKDTYVGSLYLGMLASLQSTMNTLNLNNGKEYRTLLTDGSEQDFGLDVTSALFRGEYEPGNFHGVAIDVSSLKEAVSFGTEYQPETVGRITFRSDDVAKVYWTAGSQDVLKTDDVFSCEQRIFGVSGIRFPNEYLGSI